MASDKYPPLCMCIDTHILFTLSLWGTLINNEILYRKENKQIHARTWMNFTNIMVGKKEQVTEEHTQYGLII